MASAYNVVDRYERMKAVDEELLDEEAEATPDTFVGDGKQKRLVSLGSLEDPIVSCEFRYLPRLVDHPMRGFLLGERVPLHQWQLWRGEA